jgi:hypothetical protein
MVDCDIYISCCQHLRPYRLHLCPYRLHLCLGAAEREAMTSYVSLVGQWE